MADQLYVSKPGGVIVRMADGTSQQLKYGAPVPYDLLAEHQKRNATIWADDTFRGQTGDETLEAAAHARAARSQEQPGSSSSPIPSNYSELSENAAAQLVMRYAANPDAQAAILVHERLYGGNRKIVVDAGEAYAKAAAELQIQTLAHNQGALARLKQQLDTGEGEAFYGPPQQGPGDQAVPGNDIAHRVRRAGETDLLVPPPSGAGSEGGETPPKPQTKTDPAGAAGVKNLETVLPGDEAAKALQERIAQLEAENAGLQDQIAARHETERGGTEISDFSDEKVWTKAKLDAYAEQHSVEDFPKSGNRDEKVAALAKAGHEKPQTPPADS